MRNTGFTRGDALFFTVVTVLFYVQCLNTWMYADDFYYSFYHTMTIPQCAGDTFAPVMSLSDAFMDQVRAYTEWNGRIIVHTVTAYFCGVLGMDAFRVANSLVFGLLAVALTLLVRRGVGRCPADKYLVALALFLFMPYPGCTLFGNIACVVNYLWVACAVAWYLLLYERVASGQLSERWYMGVSLFVVSLIVGSLQESFTIGMSGALFLYCCFHLRQFRGNIVWLAVGLWIGTAIVTLAPGNFARLAMTHERTPLWSVKPYLLNAYNMLLCTPMLELLIVLLMVSFRRKWQEMWALLRRCHFYVLAILVNVLVAVATYTGERQMTCVELFSMLLILRLAYLRFPALMSRRHGVVSVACCVVALLVYVPVYGYRRTAYASYREWYDSPVENHCLINDTHIPLTRRMSASWLSGRYLDFSHVSSWFYSGISIMKTGGRDKDYVTCTSPVPTSEFAGYPYDKDGIFHNAEKGFYLFRRDSRHPIHVLSVVTERTGPLSGLRTRLLGGGIYKIGVKDKTFPIVCGDTIYYMYYYVTPSLPVYGFTYD